MNMPIKRVITQVHLYVSGLLLIVMVIWSTVAFSQDDENETSLAKDLRTALTLQGINCDGISDLEINDESGYDVECNGGGRYIISQTADGIISVVDKVTGMVRKGMGTLLGAVPLTGQIFSQKEELTEHDAEVARSLFSIINLSGNACDTITDVDSTTADEHLVSCASGQSYRVYTSEDGLVLVDALTEDGN